MGLGIQNILKHHQKVSGNGTDCRVEQVLELMDHLKVDTAKLVGNSMGGYVSLNLVMTAPERFEKIMLMGSAGGAASRTPEIGRMIGFYKNPTHAALKNLTKWFVYDEKSLGEELESVLRERYEMIIRPEVKRSYLNNMFPGRGEILIPPSALRRMEQPFLLVHGFEDRFVTKESSLSMMQYLPNAQLHLIKGCGHWIQIEKRELVNKIGSIEEAMEIVNDSRFGLQASIYTNNVKNAFYASEELHVGGVVINDVPTFRVDQMPYGGVKDSGTGREGIKYAVEKMTEMKLIVWNQN